MIRISFSPLVFQSFCRMNLLKLSETNSTHYLSKCVPYGQTDSMVFLRDQYLVHLCSVHIILLY